LAVGSKHDVKGIVKHRPSLFPAWPRNPRSLDQGRAFLVAIQRINVVPDAVFWDVEQNDT